MKRSYRNQIIIVTGLIIVVGAMLFLVLSKPTPAKGSCTLQMVSADMSNNISRITLQLSNGTDRAIAIVDDAAGQPAWLMEAEDGRAMWLAPVANTTKLTLAPGATFTGTVTLTNPPQSFRLQAALRDLQAEKRVFSSAAFLPGPLREKFLAWRKKDYTLDNVVSPRVIQTPPNAKPL